MQSEFYTLIIPAFSASVVVFWYSGQQCFGTIKIITDIEFNYSCIKSIFRQVIVIVRIIFYIYHTPSHYSSLGIFRRMKTSGLISSLV